MKDNFQFFYYQPKHFEELFDLRMKFENEHNPEKRPITNAEKKKLEKAERKYLQSNSSSKYYRYYLCAKDDKLIGHIWFGQQDENRQKGFIDELYVESKYRKNGIATVLIDEAISWMKGKNCLSIELDVKTQNKAATKLYQKIGFHEQKPKWINFKMELDE